MVKRDMVPLMDIGEDDLAGKEHAGCIKYAVAFILVVQKCLAANLAGYVDGQVAFILQTLHQIVLAKPIVAVKMHPEDRHRPIRGMMLVLCGRATGHEFRPLELDEERYTVGEQIDIVSAVCLLVLGREIRQDAPGTVSSSKYRVTP